MIQGSLQIGIYFEAKHFDNNTIMNFLENIRGMEKKKFEFFVVSKKEENEKKKKIQNERYVLVDFYHKISMSQLPTDLSRLTLYVWKDLSATK